MIKVEHLSKSFGDLVVLKDISIEIQTGEVISIIGPSGTGKSTFLRCLNLLDQPSGGTISVDGINLLDAKTDVPKIRQKMNMVFQSFNLFSHLSILENLTIGPIKLQGMNRSEANKKSIELLKLVGLAEKAESYPDELSGGQKQRVAIARALANNPEILLCDEATSALDPDNTKEVIQTLKNIKQKYPITVLFITHQMEVAKSLFDRVAVMSNGKVVEVGSSYDVFAHPQSEAAKNLINKSFEGVVPPEVLEHEKNLYLITFKEENAYEPVISDISRRFTNTDLSIIAGNIEYIQKKPLGRLLISLRGNDANEIDSVLSVLKEKAYVHKYTFAKGVENV